MTESTAFPSTQRGMQGYVRSLIWFRLSRMSSRSMEAVGSADAAKKAARIDERVAAFGRAAVAHGFAFHGADGRGPPAYLRDKLPAAMKLMDVRVRYPRPRRRVSAPSQRCHAREAARPVAVPDGR